MMMMMMMMICTAKLTKYCFAFFHHCIMGFAPQWRSRTFGRQVRWSNLPPYCLRFWKMHSLFKASRTNA